MKSFPNVDIEALSVIGTSVDHPHPNPLPEGEGIKGANPFSGGEGIKRGEIDVVKGRIPFEEYKYDPEVVGKSGYYPLGTEPLSYVRVDSQLPTPNGFESLDGSSPVAYWASKANAGKVVPYAFRTFEEIQRYDVYLSGFDLSGVYIGRSDLYLFDKEQKSGRWHFNFQYLRDLKRFEFRQWDNEIVEIRIVGAQHVAPGKKAVNFIFGNLSIAVGESVEFLLGLGTQPLITAYNQNPYKDTLIYGFAYGADGIILDHHDLGIGVEKVSIKRVDLQTYKVRLISYERILPVWEGIIHAGTLHSK
ncbi:MAG: hypothetical protein HY201_03290 [Nitrospirae bacterium]|nr:hypothetical protein [Candidatus Troglogloeales bacterium]